MRSDVDKKKRHDAIREIIRLKPIRSQNELVREIRNRSLSVTQTTVSRDLEELGVGKWNGRYQIQSRDHSATSWFAGLKQHVHGWSPVGTHFVILNTHSGSSPVVEKMIYDLSLPEVSGLVSGLNHVLIICADEQNRRSITDLLADAI